MTGRGRHCAEHRAISVGWATVTQGVLLRPSVMGYQQGRTHVSVLWNYHRTHTGLNLWVSWFTGQKDIFPSSLHGQCSGLLQTKAKTWERQGLMYSIHSSRTDHGLTSLSVLSGFVYAAFPRFNRGRSSNLCPD